MGVKKYMRFIILVLALAYCVCTSAAEKQPQTEQETMWVAQTGSDNFEIREKATKELSKLPYERLPLVFEWIKKSIDAESTIRLRKAAHSIYTRWLYDNDADALRLRTSVGVRFSDQFWNFTVTHEEQKKESDGGKKEEPKEKEANIKKEADNFFVERLEAIDVNGPCDGKLLPGDLVAKVNDKFDIIHLMNYAKVGEKINITVVRMHSGYSSYYTASDKQFDFVTVEITPVLVEIDNEDMTRILEGKWQEYVKNKQWEK